MRPAVYFPVVGHEFVSLDELKMMPELAMSDQTIFMTTTESEHVSGSIPFSIW